MSLPHFTRFLEFYYQNPRPAALESVLSGLAREGALSQSQNRLFLAAFLAQLLREKKLAEKKVVTICKKLGSSGLQLLAWTLHLANMPTVQPEIKNLLKDNPALLAQIKRSPGPLEKYDPRSEKTILLMYWAAFMASGQTKWINTIAELALEWNQAQKQGLSGPATGADAAASLYEFSPKHEKVRNVLKDYLQEASPENQDFLQIILRKR